MSRAYSGEGEIGGRLCKGNMRGEICIISTPFRCSTSMGAA